ncbi:helix-turn-helix transcriptional regulator [Sporosarcina sp. E16_3]|uniref:helix-turn-helix domain-containing protein n=1 Tax=Sporosarcina sp. E16_3 TaxID=2789293 RepID=UPI001A936900|nr:helix-turn-helix transcriptional regulator [Sporosarcina sp. E16_3]
MFTYAKLRSILDRRGISLRQLARDTGITSNCTGDLNNDRPVGIDKLAIVCQYLNVSIEEIVEVLPKAP